ncbi:MAG: GNAT family protein [Burkholderiaceae bacterium]
MSNNPSHMTQPEMSASAHRYAAEQIYAEVRLDDGTRVLMRPIHLRDVAFERRFVEALLPAARGYRFLETLLSPSEALLQLMASINPATDAAYVAVLGTGDPELEIGLGRFSSPADGKNCEFAVTVAGEWQNKGLDTFLMERLIGAASARGLETLYSSDACDNTRMRQFAEHLHFHDEQDPDDAQRVRYNVDLKESDPLTTS